MTQPISAAPLAASLPYGGAPVPGIITAGQITAASLGPLCAAGITRVLDIRMLAEPRGFDEPTAVRAAGLEYIAVPFTAATLDDGIFDRVRAVLRDAPQRPVLFHCATANRVGAALIPYLVLDLHMSREDAMHTAGRVGLRSSDMAQAALEYVERHGDADPEVAR
jgi:protein tyrosine phosphatase (PTP) superfamily phosphohydrolase (DUF442 family)